jgi:FXSXX-COOH protein
MQDDLYEDDEVLCSDLPDLNGVCLSDLDKVPPSALVESVRRILEESEKQPAAYQQYHANI